jgi:hypothetical protein
LGVFPDDPDSLSDKEEIWYYIKGKLLLRGTPWLIRGRIFDHSWEEWNPVENFLAAWEVAEKLQQKFGCSIDVRIHSSRNSDKIWTGERWEYYRYAVIVSGGKLGYDSPSCSFTIFNNSPCAAICLAALKAIESQVSDGDQPDQEG